MTDHIISEGDQWTIWDTLDGQVAVTFSSWTHYDPEARAREAFALYPRQARLWRERIVKHEKHLIDSKHYPRDTPYNETNAATVAETSN